MENWKDENISAIMEYSFDFDRYIEERLREIDDLDERRFAKKVLVEGLGKVIRSTEKKYKELERRIYEEIKLEDNQFESVITIIRREHYDPMNGTLYPVVPEDLDEKKLLETLSAEGNLYMGTVFLEMDQVGIRKMEEKNNFAGSIAVENEKRAASFLLRPAVRYRDMVESLYLVFQDNHVLWETINMGYLDKFYDIYLDAATFDSDIEGSIQESLMQVNSSVEFGEFESHVFFDMIPLWNMDWVTFKSAGFMEPCIDGIYYEHEFLLGERKEDGYLIQTNEEILEIRREEGKILIKSQKETFNGWKALHIIQKETIRSLDYTAPILTNRKKDSFFRRYSAHSKVQILTKTDLFRRIMELDIRDYIEVTGYEICDNAKNYPAVEGMNWFVRDELFPMESRKVLLLKFEEKNQGCYLNDSMIRFVISQMQMEISEYRCVGVMA